MSKQTDNGRAFEWAIGLALQAQTGFKLKPNESSKNAEKAFVAASAKKQTSFENAGKMAVEHILKKESFSDEKEQDGHIEFNADKAGIAGDVRDVLLIAGKRTIGISCKNNHEAMKHSRLSATVDFVKTWGVRSSGCSENYWNAVKPIFEKLKKIKEESNGQCLWRSLDRKAEDFYWPLLDAWEKELLEQKKSNEGGLCRAIVAYLVGQHDFYKVIFERSARVYIQAWNFNKTLGTKQTKYPDTLVAINNKNGGQYSKTVVFNHGYSINFRIHNASSRVEASLKFDIKAIGLPTSEVYQQTIDLSPNP